MCSCPQIKIDCEYSELGSKKGEIKYVALLLAVHVSLPTIVDTSIQKTN